MSEILTKQAIEEIKALRAENAALREALERARGCIKGLIARTPVRDVSETLAEIDAALGTEGHAQGHSQP